MLQVPEKLWDLQNKRIEKLEDQVQRLMFKQFIMGVVLLLVVMLGDDLVAALWAQLQGVAKP